MLYCTHMQIKPYRIEKGIPVTKAQQPISDGKVTRAGLTIGALSKGESFAIKEPVEAIKGAKTMRDFNRRERDNKGTRFFVSRKTGEGVRIWRVK